MSITGFLKRLFVSICLIVASIVSIGAATLTSNDPNWLGARESFSNTEGNDFWLTFMNNATFDPTSAQYANITFELKVAVSARQQTHVILEVGTAQFEHTVQANETYFFDLSSMSNDVYLLESEGSPSQYKGVHVYTDEPDKNFSCFTYSRVGERGESSRDGTLIIPTNFLGKEYYVQTYPEDTYSSEFAIVATEDNTTVRIKPTFETFGGVAAGSEITLTMNAGDAYLVASRQHTESDTYVDLSGSRICATKPVAVFNGNQQTNMPYSEGGSKDFLSEQTLPIAAWGTDYYLALLGNTLSNVYIITAGYDGTEVHIDFYDGTTHDQLDTVLNAGESLVPYYPDYGYLPYTLDEYTLEATIHCSQPTLCYVYTTSSTSNTILISTRPRIECNFGDPANAMMPAWNHLTKSMNFFDHDLDPLRPSDPKRYMVYLVTSAGNIGNIQVDGVTIPATNYTVFDAAPNVAYVSWQISQNPSHYHTVESSGDGFVGMVYALTEAQGYLYTLGYTPDPYQDSLFVSNEGNIMSAKSYDVTPRLEEGWYQRQWNEWKKDHERLDTAQVCEGDTVKWTFQTPLPKNAQFVDWYLYDVTGTEQTIKKAYTNLEESKLNAQMDEEKNGNKLFRWSHQFVLPDESYLPPEDRTPMMEYELQVVVHKQHIICEELEDNIDTLRTTVRVTRIYHDTVYQYICMGDSYEFFNDSFPNQGDLTQKGTTKSVTTFIADKTDGESTTDYEWKARLGENIYDRAYQTIYGCDSTYTLYLFVCDTFRRVDTLHLCDNQSLVYEGEKFKGILSPDADGTIVTKDTVAIIYDKTTYCPCKQNPKYPAFQGCDSIFELHLMLHKTYRDTVIDTMCYNTKPDSLYRWPIQYNTRDSLISKNHPNMVFNDDLQAWVGFFSDTLQTQTCPECNNGNGCDSINILQLIIPKSYYDVKQDSICEWTYDRDTRTKIPNVYQWIHHRNGAGYVELPTSGTYYDSCVTRFGCDSIYTLELKYLKPFLKVDKHVMATNQTYKWHGVTFGPFLDEEFKNLEDGDTTLYFHNDNENQVHPVNGCDSIYRLELTLMDTYLFRSYRTICDYDSIHWRDSIIVGSKWQGSDPFDIRLQKTTTHVFDSLKTVELPVRDSVYQLTVTMRPSYEHFDTLYVCDNDSLEWEGQWYQGTGGTRDDERHYDTKYHCDSAFYLHLIVKPSYHFPVEDSLVCQNDPFVWTQHTQIVIPTDQPGEYFYYDSCLTTTCPACEGGGCDSIYTLHLVVNPIHDIYDTLTICASDSLHWQGLLFTGDEFANYGGTFTPGDFRRATTNLHAGEHSDTAWYHTNHYGCDSIYHLTLNVLPVYRDTIERRTCQDAGTYHYEHLNNGVGGYLPAAHLSDSLVRNDTLHSVLGCDSIITLHFYVDSVYKYTQDAGFVCQQVGGTWEWRNEFGDLLDIVSLDKGDSVVILGERYTTVHGCDSAFGVELYIAPIHDIYDTITICANDSAHWQGLLFTGDEFANYGGTYDPASFRRVTENLHAGEHSDTAWYHTTNYGCDSIYHLTLNVLPVYRDTIERRTCQDAGTYHYEHLNNGVGGYLPAAHLSDSLVRNDTLHSVLGCDSIITLHFYVDSVYKYTQDAGFVCQEVGGTWEWRNEFGDLLDIVSLDKGDSVVILGERYTTVHGCDSAFGVELYIAPIHDIYDTITICANDSAHWQGLLFTGDEFANYGGTYDPASFRRVTENLHAGEHSDTAWYHTTNYGCDSIYHLTLNVLPIYRTDIERRTCQDAGTYHYEHLNNGVGGYLPAAHLSDSLVRNDTLHSVLGCDSIITLHFYVDSVYKYTQDAGFVCQQVGGTWEWRNEFGDLLDIVSLDKGDSVVILGERYTTVHGCDSAFGVELYIAPIHDIYDTITICANDSAHWQGLLFTGDEFANYGGTYDPASFRRVTENLHAGEHSDTAWYHTTNYGCDSIYHLALNVLPVGRETIERRVCQNNTGYYYEHLNNGVGGYLNAAHLSDALTRKDTIQTALGCDSIITLNYFVDSVYNYTSQQVVCQEYGVDWIWYENGVPQDTISLDKGDTTYVLGRVYHTIHGCDSMYGKSVYVAPIYHIYDTVTLCSSDSLHWQGMLFTGDEYANYGRTYVTSDFDSVKVNLAANEYDYAIRRGTAAYSCDSVHHLHLTVNAVGRETIERRACQSEGTYYYEHLNNGVGGYLKAAHLSDALTRKDTIQTSLGCDSIITLNYFVDSVYNYTSQQVVCQEYNTDWIWYENGVPQDTISLDKGDTTYVLGRVYHTIHGCDSMYGKSVYVAPIYHIYDTVTLCSSDSLHWQGMLFTGDEYTNYGRTYVTSDFDSVKVNLAANEYDYSIRRGTAAYSCDSVHHLHLTVNAVGRETIERRACQSEGTYYYEHLNNGVGGYLNAAHLSDALTRKDTIQTSLGCDSIITLNYFVDSVYNYTSQQVVCQEYNTDWIWYENGVPQDTISLDKGDTTYVLGRVYHTIHGCDSTYGKSVYVAPIYHIYDTLTLCESDSLSWQGILFTGREFANYNPNGYDATHYRRVQTGLAGQANYYTDTAQYYTVHACDSVYHLALRVNTVYRASTERRVCQSEGTYFYEYLNNGVGGYLPAVHLSDALTRNDTMLTALGCDSIVTLHYFVDSVYDYRQTQYVCQDTINSLWEWIDDEGHSHGFINIADSGNYSFDEPHTTIHGCDSTYGLILRVKPIYRFDSAYVICENERMVWQGRQYTGDSVHDATLNDSIFLTVGLHYDTAHYTTVEGCDSTYYVQIRVNPVFDTTSYMHTCYNETFVWHQQDIDGLYDDPMWDAQETDTIFISAEMAMQQQIVRDTTMRYYERMLHTVNGCDSLSRLRLTIHPTYFFYTDTSVCANDVVEYRGKLFSHEDTTYTDTLHTAFGCDSIFQLHMHVRPAYLFHRYRDICDNETLYLEDNGLDIVWQPGDRIPGPRDYVEFPGKTREGCDSSYFYHVTVHPTHYFESYDTVCSSQLMLLQGSHYVGLDTIYDALTHQEPLDIVYTDSLHTSTCPYCENQVGCDSIYRIYAHILPQYYHLDRDTICDNEVLTWRAHIYEGLQPGDYITIDSLTTKAGCDSVYELRLHVAPTYYFEDHITKCADEDLTWRAHNLDHIEAGDHLIYDSLHTEYFGCDSVYHLYLTVLDTTFEIIYDTICRTESYDFHGRMLMEPGDYKDTTTNAWGCHHFTYLHLEVIEPTVPTAWADSICADDSAYELFYTYTGRDPIGYSVYYDEEGHYYGFEDQIDIPITTEEELHMLTLPMPFRGNDITNYPKPDYYNIRLVLDNGICTNPDLCATDTNIVLSYPSWLTQQRFGDVIALYNEKYNGGYYWDAYQWYHGDELLVGETHEYLYIPTGLIVGDQYHVRLTRVGETVDFQTCPITIVGDPIADDFAPQMGYLSVVPTCIVTGHPYANILSRKDGTYRISNSNGLLVSEGVFRADVTQVELPAVPGMYIFQLWSADTPEEPYRSIKVIVKEVCENCNMPF